MTDEQLKRGNELVTIIARLQSERDALSDPENVMEIRLHRPMLIGDPLHRVSEDTKTVVRNAMISDLQQQIAKFQKEYDAL